MSFKLPSTTVIANGRISSSLSGVNLQWDGTSTLSIRTQYLPTQFQLQLDRSTIGSLFINATSGSISLNNSMILQDSNIYVTSATLSINLNDTTAVDLGTAVPSACLFSSNTVCQDVNCTQIVLGTDPNDFTNSSIPTLRVRCTTCYVHMLVQSASPLQPTGYQRGSPAINFSAYDLTRLGLQFSAIPPWEVVYVNIMGSGSPLGTWTWSSRKLFLVFPRSFMDVFSLTLLSPRSSQINVTLAPAFCPGPVNWPTFEAIVAIDALVKATIKTTPNPQNLWTFQTYTPDGLITENYQVVRTTDTGEYYISSPSFLDNLDLLFILVCNILLTLITSIYTLFLLISRVRRWKAQSIQAWGKIHYGKHVWKDDKENHYLQEGGFYFIGEFLIGYPRQIRGLAKMVLSVVVHMGIIIAIPFPLFAASLAYHRSSLYYTGTIPAASIIGYIFCLASVAFALANLFVFFLETPLNSTKSKVVIFLNRIFSVLIITVLCLSCLYATDLFFWIILGALVNPNKILPFASVAIVLFFHTVGVIGRVSKLYTQLEEQSKAGMQEAKAARDRANTVADQAAPPATFGGKLSVADAFQLLQKSQVLEISGLTLRGQIIQELTLFFMLVLFFAFLLLGFTGLSTDQNLASAISSTIIFLVGGGIQIPISRQGGESAALEKYEEELKRRAKDTGAVESQKKNA
eukprot:TRINITY_DN4801_c2_g1_i2.p1 TRINITY_DN4801_c2_g1~~TRINITY_DN4801_c2_g1_i2.p1  ORF type:complete len:688 (-),score=145.76 TRINITY_DN4801_c2_g1_i2:674-2737(-)